MRCPPGRAHHHRHRPHPQSGRWPHPSGVRRAHRRASQPAAIAVELVSRAWTWHMSCRSLDFWRVAVLGAWSDRVAEAGAGAGVSVAGRAWTGPG